MSEWEGPRGPSTLPPPPHRQGDSSAGSPALPDMADGSSDPPSARTSEGEKTALAAEVGMGRAGSPRSQARECSPHGARPGHGPCWRLDSVGLVMPQTPWKGCWDHHQPGASRAQESAGLLQGVARGVNRCRQDHWFSGVRELREGTQIAGEQSGWWFGPELFRASGPKVPGPSTLPQGPTCSDTHAQETPHDCGRWITACVTFVAPYLPPRDLGSRAGGPILRAPCGCTPAHIWPGEHPGNR